MPTYELVCSVAKIYTEIKFLRCSISRQNMDFSTALEFRARLTSQISLSSKAVAFYGGIDISLEHRHMSICRTKLPCDANEGKETIESTVIIFNVVEVVEHRYPINTLTG